MKVPWSVPARNCEMQARGWEVARSSLLHNPRKFVRSQLVHLPRYVERRRVACNWMHLENLGGQKKSMSFMKSKLHRVAGGEVQTCHKLPKQAFYLHYIIHCISP
jgi:hypothetical protein